MPRSRAASAICVFLIPRQLFLLHTDHLRAFRTQLLRAPATEHAMLCMSLSGQSFKSGTSNAWLLLCFVLFRLQIQRASTQHAVNETAIIQTAE